MTQRVDYKTLKQYFLMMLIFDASVNSLKEK